MSSINKELLKKQKVTKEQEQAIKNLHKLLDMTMEAAHNLNEKKHLTKITGGIIANTIRDIEFMLQKNWNFKQDEDYHTYTYKLSGCQCPILDNENSFGSPYKWTNISCPYHA